MSDDNQFVDFLINILLLPASDFYISTILYDPAGQSLDPRTVDRLDLGTFHISSFDMNAGIVITGLHVQGLSNTQVKFKTPSEPDITVDGNDVTFHGKQPNEQADYVRPPQVPNQILANGVLNVTLDGDPMPPGTFDLTIKTIDDLTGVFRATQTDGNNLQTATVEFRRFTIAPAVTNANIVIDVKLDTSFVGTINELLNLPANLQKIVDAVNGKLSSTEVLNGLSNYATQAARKALSSR